MHSETIQNLWLPMAANILILDDSTSLPRFIAVELQAEGYQASIVCEAVSPQTIAQMQPDLILLNWHLRRASSVDLCRQLPLVYERDYRPIVIAMVNDESSGYFAQEVGADTCLLKPFSMSDLLSAIEHYLSDQPQMWDVPLTARKMGAAV